MRTRMQLNTGAMDDLCGARLPTTRKSISAAGDSSSFQQNEILLEELAGTIQTSPINGFASLVSYAPTADRPIHRWFWYREGYSVELVNEFIKTLPRGSLVLDPFCGAGTSLLAAKERIHRCQVFHRYGGTFSSSSPSAKAERNLRLCCR